MSMVGFPLLLIPLAIYNIVVFLMPGVSFAEPLVRLTLMSGAEWSLNLGDILLAISIFLLLLEVIKGARPGAKYLTDHLLSLIVFGAAAAEFVLWSRFGTSTYFLLTMLALVDFLSGIALRTRRPVQLSPAMTSRGAATTKPSVAPEPHSEPAPSPPETTPVYKTVSPAYSEPKIGAGDVATSAPSPELHPSGLSSGEAPPPSPDEPPR